MYIYIHVLVDLELQKLAVLFYEENVEQSTTSG